MAKVEEGAERAIVEEPPARAEILAEAQPKTYSQEEVDTLTATKVEEATESARKAEFDRLNPLMSQQGADLKRLKEQLAQPLQPSRLSRDEIILADMEARQSELSEPNPRIAQLKAEIATERQKETQLTQLRWQEQVTQQQREKFDQRIKEAGLDPKDERLDDFHNAFEDAQEDGRFGKAERKLDRILSKVKPSEPKSKEPEEDTFDKRLEEEKRKWMEEHGLLTSETGGPSASGALAGLTAASLARKMREPGGMEWFRKNEAEIDRLHREGKIT